MHHFNEASLAACFHGLDGTKAVGIDGTDNAVLAHKAMQRIYPEPIA
jgi:hypothetical protein